MSERETSLEKSHKNKVDFLLDNPLVAVDDCLYFSRMIDEAYRVMMEEGDSVLRTSEAGRKWLETYEFITTDPDDE